jgi:Rieske Fe-S protein
MTGSSAQPNRLTRRCVVAAVGGAGLTMALTACGSEPEKTAPAVSAPEGADSTGSGNGEQSGGGKVIAATSEIPQGGGKVVGDVVITQPAAGEFKAFSSKCTHQGCAVQGVENNVIVCPCHNSRFDAANGSVQGGPATAPLPPASIKVEGDSILLV